MSYCPQCGCSAIRWAGCSDDFHYSPECVDAAPTSMSHTHAVELGLYIDESRQQLLGGRCDGILDRKDLP